MINTIAKYRNLLNKILDKTILTDSKGAIIGGFEESAEKIAKEVLLCDSGGGGIIFIGNGGSAAICDHCALDWLKNGRVKTRTFYGNAQLTCFANDYGYENVFSKPIEDFTKNNDLLIAISSSGKSINILNAVKAARKVGMKVITLSGFAEDNPLRKMGDLNIHVPSGEYGFVEVSHQILLHAVSDAFDEMRKP
jgi:D-sedoheptulose 7-phosphate isomerase